MTTSARVTTIAGLAATLLVVGGCGPPYTDVRPLAATSTCTNASVLTSWTIHRLARQTVVVPVQETDVAAVTSEVSAGVGGSSCSAARPRPIWERTSRRCGPGPWVGSHRW